MLKRILQQGALVVLLPVVTLFISSILFGVYGTYLVVELIYQAFVSPEYREVTRLVTKFFSVVDVYLLAMVLYIFALGLYELFVGRLDVADELKIETVDQLKAKLASVVILFVAIAFTKELVEWKNPLETLLFGVSSGVLMAVLIQYYKAKADHA
jgi:uncharacterized membrane protein YqhA